jgi:hypothetical protein
MVADDVSNNSNNNKAPKFHPIIESDGRTVSQEEVSSRTSTFTSAEEGTEDTTEASENGGTEGSSYSMSQSGKERNVKDLLRKKISHGDEEE